MESLLVQHSILIRRLRREHTTVIVPEILSFFDNIISYIKDISYTNAKTDLFNLLTLICDDLASIHVLQCFNHPAIINHPIFIHIGRILEMLLVKSNHLHSIPMKNYEEDCFYSISYFITQLCLYKNETIKSFYGSISDEVAPVTDKINIRDLTINESSRKSNPIADKPNKKVIGLPPSAPQARPLEENEMDITKVPHLKMFINPVISTSVPKTIRSKPEASFIQSRVFPPKTYQEVILTKSFLNKLVRSIDDLSQNEYSPYHVKYKVIDRLVRLCSKLNIANPLLASMLKCLRSKIYREVFTTIEPEQFRLNPKQLFFIYECTQFIIQHEFEQQERIPQLLCQTMIDVTSSIVDNILPNTGNFFLELEF